MPIVNEPAIDMITVVPSACHGSGEDPRENVITRALAKYIRLTPVLWGLGLLVPTGMTLLVYSLLRQMREMRLRTTALLWWGVGFMQAISVFVNWFDSGLGAGHLLYRLSSASVSGWFFLGAAIAAGQIYRLNSPKVVRAICVLGLYILIFGSLTIGVALVLREENLSITSPIGMLLPSNLPAIENAFTMRFSISDEVFGKSIPRLILFFPWSVCLGFAGIAICFIALQERRRLWKLIGFCGGIMGIFGSMSRASVLAFVVTSLLYVWGSWRSAYRWAMIVLLCVLAVPMVALDAPVMRYFSQFTASVTGARQGSTEARQMGYEESWRGFLRSPLVGHGWPGEPLTSSIPMPVGSHSTVYGTLYTGGLITFIPFCIAMLWSLTALFFNRGSGIPASRSAISIAVSLCILCYGEGIYSFAVPALFAFCWIGAAFNRDGYSVPDIQTAHVLPKMGDTIFVTGSRG
jgi:uncharacterized membrane protein (UPF0136 family)